MVVCALFFHLICIALLLFFVHTVLVGYVWRVVNVDGLRDGLTWVVGFTLCGCYIMVVNPRVPR